MALVSSAGRREVFDEATRRRLSWLLELTCRHWLAFANGALVLFAVLPIVAPFLELVGANGAALRIFQVYSFTCHQMPSRSYFIFGHQMAYCERNTAIYGTMALTGLAYVRLRARDLTALSIPVYLILILPMAIDGFTQLFELRESTWYLRGITGALFGVATVWLTFPRLEENFSEIGRDLRCRSNDD